MAHHDTDKDTAAEPKVDKSQQKFGYGDRNDGIERAEADKGADKQAGENSDDPDHDPLLVDEPQKVARADAQRPLQQS